MEAETEASDINRSTQWPLAKANARRSLADPTLASATAASIGTCKAKSERGAVFVLYAQLRTKKRHGPTGGGARAVLLSYCSTGS